jgi:predicted PurR-regulated permease PerM
MDDSGVTASDLTIRDIKRLIVFTVLLLIAIAIAFLAVRYAWRVFFLAFAALLLAIMLDSFTTWVQSKMHLSRKPAYFLVAGSIVLLGVLIGWFLVPQLLHQAAEIASLIPKSLEQIRQILEKQTWGSYLVRFVQRESLRFNAEPKLTTAASNTADAIAGAILVLVVGSYAALDPQTYIAGLLRILPEKRRERARRVGAQVLYTLRWWLLGQLVPMAFLGVLTMLGLWLLHVPLAFTLGLLTAVMIFIPYLGALVSEIPAVLVALQQGPRTMLYVLILYLGVHSLEAYLITPLIQKKATRLPPIVTVLAEFLMWIVAGPLGVIIATPLAAAILTLIRTLYLHESPEKR